MHCLVEDLEGRVGKNGLSREGCSIYERSEEQELGVSSAWILEA